jgi:hypothetical protein
MLVPTPLASPFASATVWCDVSEPYAVVGPYRHQYSTFPPASVRTVPTAWAEVPSTLCGGLVRPRAHPDQTAIDPTNTAIRKRFTVG